MNILKHLLLLVFVISSVCPAFSQIVEDPAVWKYEVKKTGPSAYDLIFHLTLKAPWHIWSLQPGGDGYEIAPSFTFDTDARVIMNGSIVEKGKKNITKMEGIDGKVTFLTGKIDYVQHINATAKRKITGKHEYQLCNDRMCLPPKVKDFVFEIR